MRQALKLPLPSSQIASITRNSAARPLANPLSLKPASAQISNATSPKRSFTTTRAKMSLIRPASFFSSPIDDFDVFPSSSLRDLMLMNPFAPAAAVRPSVNAGNYRIWSGPKVDLHEEDTRFVLTAELPGVKKDDLKINVDADRRRLTLEGYMKSEYSSQPTADSSESSNTTHESSQAKGSGHHDKPAAKSKDDKNGPSSAEVSKRESGGQVGTIGHALVSERVYGSFSRSFTLPPTADFSNDASLKARFSDGLLRLEIPKKKEEHSKTRQIPIEASA